MYRRYMLEVGGRWAPGILDRGELCNGGEGGGQLVLLPLVLLLLLVLLVLLLLLLLLLRVPLLLLLLVLVLLLVVLLLLLVPLQEKAPWGSPSAYYFVLLDSINWSPGRCCHYRCSGQTGACCSGSG